MAYSLNPSTNNCYEGTTCLINKFGIRDEEKLAEIEAQITFAKAAILEKNPIIGDLDFEGISWMGQGFAHQMFVVYKNTNPNVSIKPINMSDSVLGMYKHVLNS